MATQPNITTEGYFGAATTVEFIRKGAIESQEHPSVRELVEEISQGLESRDVASEALAIYYFLLAHTRYMNDPNGIELVRAPWLIVNKIRSGHVPSLDCDDMAALICALGIAAGREVRVGTVAFKDMFYKGERQYSHVFAQIREPRTKRWITLDPVAEKKTAEMRSKAVAAKFWPVR